MRSELAARFGYGVSVPWVSRLDDGARSLVAGASMLVLRTDGREDGAQEVAPFAIRANGVAPGAIRTSINRPAWETPDAYERLITLVPYKRIGEPDDIAQAVAWLV